MCLDNTGTGEIRAVKRAIFSTILLQGKRLHGFPHGIENMKILIPRVAGQYRSDLVVTIYCKLGTRNDMPSSAGNKALEDMFHMWRNSLMRNRHQQYLVPSNPGVREAYPRSQDSSATKG